MSAGEAAGQQAQGEATQDGGQEQAQQGPDLSALTQQLEQQGQSLEELRGFLQSNPWQQPEGEPEGEPEPDLPDLGFLESGDPEFDQQLATNLQSLIATEAQKQAQQLLSPLQQQFQEDRRERAAEALVAEFPELNEPEHAQRVIGMTREYAEMMGHPELADNPQMWRLMHLANAAMVAAKEEGADGSLAHVEGAGGAGAGQQQPQNAMDLIMQRGDDEGLGAGVLNFGR